MDKTSHRGLLLAKNLDVSYKGWE